MNFGISTEQKMFQETLGKLLESNFPSSSRDDDSQDPNSCWTELANMGLAGMAVSEEYGGSEMELLDIALMSEIFGYNAVHTPFLGHTLACMAISIAGSEEQKRKWLPALASGRLLGTVAFSESSQSWNPSQWKCSVDANSSGRAYTVNGEKCYVPFAEEADLIIAGIVTGKLVLIESGQECVVSSPISTIDPQANLYTVSFDNAECESLFDTHNKFPVADKIFCAGLILMAADSFGGSNKCLELSVSYSKEREQFGKTIENFQAVKHQLANMALSVEPGRALYWYAAHAFDYEEQETIEKFSSMSKAHICDRFSDVARNTVEAHGGIGFTWECDVQLWFKRSMYNYVYMGNSTTLREQSSSAW